VVEAREVWEEELWKVFREQAQDLREVTKSDFKPRLFDLEGCVEGRVISNSGHSTQQLDRS
jgi:hypothetical protein